MKSMRADLTQTSYANADELNSYIYGSADVVGLICLQIFCSEKPHLFERLAPAAQKLGSAFQKVNFLRDLHCDKETLGRSYFPEVTNGNFQKEEKQQIENSIALDFKEAYLGIQQLPGKSKLAVALAYYYYKALFCKIKRTTPERILTARIRINNIIKYLIFLKVIFLFKINKI